MYIYDRLAERERALHLPCSVVLRRSAVHGREEPSMEGKRHFRKGRAVYSREEPFIQGMLGFKFWRPENYLALATPICSDCRGRRLNRCELTFYHVHFRLQQDQLRVSPRTLTPLLN